MLLPRSLAAAALAAVVSLAGTAAVADTFYNDLDVTVDSVYETMNLTYDTANSAGTTGSTVIALQIDGKNAGDHPGCNIQGGPHYVALNATSSNTAVATVALSNDGVFDVCSDTVLATVTSQGVGGADVTFAVDSARTNNDPHLTFSVVEARFRVNVSEGSGNVVTGCDADPAAPAWAAAILQKSGVKNKTAVKNYVSQIAAEMGQGATFAGFVKNAHPQYENAVHDRLVVLTGRSLASAASSARPGWVCTVLTS
ncbi:hypothetical protein [Aeromicrobium sp.]|uniref:hypothetical protein n=1 Tax=Aeromicrobium sp. TaxID=1871063 RepID=UPI003C45B380